nr:hypothetical protein [Tanacetum cinerariifolium]
RHPLALRLHRNTKIKAYPKQIDWGKVIATNEIMNGHEEEEGKVAKASEDIKLSIMKDKFLAMVKSKKARVKDYTKLVVTDGMVNYVLEKYRNKWKSKDEIAYVILEDMWLKYGKDDKGKGKLVEDNRKGKEAKHHHLKVNKAILSGDDNRPPMLEKDMYDYWKSIMELYMMNKEHGTMILEFIENGPLIWPFIEENGVTRPNKYYELSATEAIQADCDVKATNIILQGLPPEVYALVRNHKVAKELWEIV